MTETNQLNFYKIESLIFSRIDELKTLVNGQNYEESLNLILGQNYTKKDFSLLIFYLVNEYDEVSTFLLDNTNYFYDFLFEHFQKKENDTLDLIFANFVFYFALSTYYVEKVKALDSIASNNIKNNVSIANSVSSSLDSMLLSILNLKKAYSFYNPLEIPVNFVFLNTAFSSSALYIFDKFSYYVKSANTSSSNLHSPYMIIGLNDEELSFLLKSKKSSIISFVQERVDTLKSGTLVTEVFKNDF